jgi:hypothetical protein
MDAQTVPGLRVVTQCPDDFGPGMGSGIPIVQCMNRQNFWRSQSQFIRDLGIDVSALRRGGPFGDFVQTVTLGDGPAIDCCMHFDAQVRYTIFTPSGSIVRHVESAAFRKDSGLVRLELGPTIRNNSRHLILAPARQFDRKANHYDMYVIDLTVLPCAPGMKRNDTSMMGNAYPDGACYPEANYRR